MKKLLCLFLLLTACSEPTMVDNTLCIPQKFFYILQAMDNGAIVQLCPEKYVQTDNIKTCIDSGTLVFIIDNTNKFIEEQRMMLPENLCFVSVGKYKYTTIKGQTKTIPQIQILPNKLPYQKVVTAEDI